jgi:hypothetical protein
MPHPTCGHHTPCHVKHLLSHHTPSVVEYFIARSPVSIGRQANPIKVQVFRVWCLGFKVSGLEFRV